MESWLFSQREKADSVLLYNTKVNRFDSVDRCMEEGSRERLVVHGYGLHISYGRDCQNIELRQREEVKLAVWIEGCDQPMKNPQVPRHLT